MNVIQGYFFDSERMLIYDSNICKTSIEIINKTIQPDEEKSIGVEQRYFANIKKTPYGVAVNSMGICPTYNCNLRCSYCGYSSSNTDVNNLRIEDISAFVKEIIKKSKIKKLISKKDDPLIVYFTGGGEPTYDWALFEDAVLYIKNYCTENGVKIKISITTNGILTNKQIDFISDNFTRVMISYDGLPSIQNSNRRGPDVGETSAIVENTITQFAIRGVPIEVRTTVWQDDYHRLKEMYHHIFSLVPKNSDVSWSIYPALEEGRAVKRIQKQKDKTYHTFLINYFALLDYINANADDKQVFCPLFADDTISHFCGSLFGDEPFLQPDGSIVLCNDSKDYSVCVGKVSNGMVEYFDHFQNDLLTITEIKYKECSNCVAYRFCKGGCPIWHLRGKENADGPVECQATKEYWQHILEMVIQSGQYMGWCLEQIEMPGIDNNVFKLKKAKE